MTKRFYVNYKRGNSNLWDRRSGLLLQDFGKHIATECELVLNVMNNLNEENEQLKTKLDDWHQRTFKAHEYFNILEKIIDEVCDDDISNKIWKEYEKKEKLIE